MTTDTTAATPSSSGSSSGTDPAASRRSEDGRLDRDTPASAATTATRGLGSSDGWRLIGRHPHIPASTRPPLPARPRDPIYRPGVAIATDGRCNSLRWRHQKVSQSARPAASEDPPNDDQRRHEPRLPRTRSHSHLVPAELWGPVMAGGSLRATYAHRLLAKSSPRKTQAWAGETRRCGEFSRNRGRPLGRSRRRSLRRSRRRSSILTTASPFAWLHTRLPSVSVAGVLVWFSGLLTAWPLLRSMGLRQVAGRTRRCRRARPRGGLG